MKLLDDLGVLWARRYWRAAIIATGIVALGVLLLGGFERAPSLGTRAQPPESPAGKRLETGAFAITPLCAWASDLYPGQPEIMRGKRRFLILRLQAENLGDDWLAMNAYLDKDLVWLADGRTDPRESKYIQRVDDHTHPGLQPGIPVHVDLIWELQAGAAVPPRPVWGVYKRRHVERGYLVGDEFWIQDGPGYRLPIPLSAPCGEKAV